MKIKFQYPKLNDPTFAPLRKEARLNNLPTGSLERAKQICGFVHGLFQHEGDNAPSSFDALTILQEARKGKAFRCVEYSILAQGLLLAYGIPARVVGLKTADVETRDYGAGHVVLEFWNDEKNKWVMCDVQWGILPELGGNFLNAVELGDAIRSGKTIKYEKIPDSRFDGSKTNYSKWVGEYLHFYDSDIEVFHNAPYTDLSSALKLMLVPNGVIRPPKIFQNTFKMNLIYTHSQTDFYQAPYKSFKILHKSQTSL